MHTWTVGTSTPSPGPSWLAVTITAAGVLLGVIFTVLGSVFVANKRLREIEITHAQKLQEVFLSNARNYLESVYVPLHLAQAQLASAYRQFQLSDNQAAGSDDDATSPLTDSIVQYLDTVEGLMNRAAGAFLSPQLEDELADLSSFLSASLTADAVKRRLTFVIRLYGTRMSRVVESSARVWPTSLSLLGIGTSVEVTKVLAAPLPSEEFEQQFLASTSRTRGLIKEVTLGARVSGKA